MSVVVPRARKKASSKRVTFGDLAAVCSSNRYFWAPIYGSKRYMRVCASSKNPRRFTARSPPPPQSLSLSAFRVFSAFTSVKPATPSIYAHTSKRGVLGAKSIWRINNYDSIRRCVHFILIEIKTWLFSQLDPVAIKKRLEPRSLWSQILSVTDSRSTPV